MNIVPENRVHGCVAVNLEGRAHAQSRKIEVNKEFNAMQWCARFHFSFHVSLIPISQSINQSINQSNNENQSINQSTNQAMNFINTRTYKRCWGPVTSSKSTLF